jgi:hypothetical protein
MRLTLDFAFILTTSLVGQVEHAPTVAWTIADNIAFRARDGVLQGNCI